MRSVALTLLAGLVVAGCKNEGGTGSSRNESPPVQWKVYRNSAGGFEVLMPESEVREETQEVPTDLGRLKMTMCGVELPDRSKTFAVSFADYPADPNYSDEAFAHKVLDGIMQGSTKGFGGTVDSKSRIKLNGHHGQEYRISGSKIGDMIYRAYLVRNRVFQMFSNWRAPAANSPADAEKFLSSFTLIE